jgi:hypothetical protein
MTVVVASQGQLAGAGGGSQQSVQAATRPPASTTPVKSSKRSALALT